MLDLFDHLCIRIGVISNERQPVLQLLRLLEVTLDIGTARENQFFSLHGCQSVAAIELFDSRIQGRLEPIAQPLSVGQPVGTLDLKLELEELLGANPGLIAPTRAVALHARHRLSWRTQRAPA